MTVTAHGVKLKANGATVTLLDVLFPVGSAYLTYENKNPSTFLGGTWALYATDRYLRGGSASAKAGGGRRQRHHRRVADAPAQTSLRGERQVLLERERSGERARMGRRRFQDRRSHRHDRGGAPFYPSYATVFVWRRTA